MLGLRGASGKGEVFVGAFGKHPGWDDHMDDPGMETQRLVDFKTLVYVEGVAAAVDSGRWQSLEPGASLPGFDHVLVSRSRGDVIVARMWSSKDGKGRSKYPMVMAAQVTAGVGAGMETVLRKVLPELEVAKERCEQAATADEVRGILDSSRGSLRAWAEAVASDPGEGADIEIPAGFIGEMADRVEFGPLRRGLCRVMYQLDRDVGMMEREPVGGIGRMNEAGGKAAAALPVSALRIPVRGGGGGGEGMAMEARVLDCLRLLLSRLEAWSPVLAIVPRGAGFVDAVVGEPRGSDVFCLLAGTSAVPLTTEIPYTIDEAFHAKVDAWVQRERGGRSVGMTTESAAKKLGVKAGRFLCLIAACAGMCLGVGAARGQTSSSAPAGVEPKQQYNNALADFQLAVIDPATSDERAAAAAKDFLVRARSVPGGVAFLGEVQRTLTAVESALENKSGLMGMEAMRMGPGGSGVYVGKVDGSVVKFSAPIAEGLPELAFARVNMPDGTVTFIQTTEMSVGQFATILAARSSGSELAKLSFPGFERGNDPRVGPRAWEWGATGSSRPGVVPARAWLSRMGLGVVADYPAGAEPAPPAADSPMQYVSPTMAVYVARLVGCRLPTAAEWGAAKAQLAGDVKESACNLRDQAWARQYEHVRATIAAGKRTQFPFAGSFAPGKAGADGKMAAREGDDGTVWFTAVGTGGGEVVHNLVGNVTEYVFDGPGLMPEARGVGAEEFVAAHGGELRVIGGSALSDPGVAVDKGQAVATADAVEGYSDVGFRLAFSSGADTRSSLGARLRRILDPLPTIQ